jgi:hypothetical protein
MKKSLVGIIVAVVLLSGYGSFAVSLTKQGNQVETSTVVFSPVMLTENQDVTFVDLSEATSYLSDQGSYAVPVVTKVFTFPFRASIKDVVVSFSQTQDISLSKPLKLAPAAIADDEVEVTGASSPSVSSNIYPEQCYSYHMAAGRQNHEIVTFVAVHLYPVQYLPSENILRCSQDATISISYELPESYSASYADQYQLVIIAPKKFANALQPLVTHKIDMGMSTKLVTMDDISSGVYFPAQGRDSAEEMKYFIKNAVEQWETEYVLLAGGRNGGIYQEKWWVPVRYSLLDDDSSEASFLTDLYFADIYDSMGNFSSWDSNDNGVFAEWTNTQKDVLDMYPDVYVGRLAFTSVLQVKTMVKKIITYETTTYGTDWFKKFIGIAGDTYPAVGDPYYEGEMATNASFQQLESLGFEASMIWTSNGLFTGSGSVIDAFSTGAGFVHFSGHGNPASWSTHPPRTDSWVSGLKVNNMSKLKNGEEQPVVIVGGCHNAQFNTSLTNIIKGILEQGLDYFEYKEFLGEFWYDEWIPRCWAWSMATQTQGGAIAVIANSGLGYGEPGADTLTQRGRHLEWLFFKAYHDGAVNLGATHATDIIYYMNEHPPMVDQTDCKIAQEWVLLGDPSLLIGGYPS